jgi:2-dehydro-3-deoxyphosphogluconate aldolase/(4S)-4-hydroxy-2-oxoglutarate aldolase
MTAIEITLRTDAALDSIRAVQAEVPELLVAAGTVNTPADLARVQELGVELALSPGATPALLKAAAESPLAFVPGVASASDVMQGLDFGFDVFKLFPAETVGGRDMLRSLGGPFPQVRFCPTGGLSSENFRDYLALDNVICCGGSWMVKEELVKGEQWDRIEELAREAMTS